MRTELYHYYNKGTDKHHIHISQDKVNVECYFHLGGELAKRGMSLEFIVIHKKEEENMTCVLNLLDNDFQKQGAQIAEKILSLLAGSGNSLYTLKLKKEKKQLLRELEEIEIQLEAGYDAELWGQFCAKQRKIEAVEKKLDGSFYDAEPETYKICGQNR